MLTATQSFHLSVLLIIASHVLVETSFSLMCTLPMVIESTAR